MGEWVMARVILVGRHVEDPPTKREPTSALGRDEHISVKDTNRQIAGIYAQDGLDIAKARDSFVRAGEWYKQEDANAYVPFLPLFRVY